VRLSAQRRLHRRRQQRRHRKHRPPAVRATLKRRHMLRPVNPDSWRVLHRNSTTYRRSKAWARSCKKPWTHSASTSIGKWRCSQPKILIGWTIAWSSKVEFSVMSGLSRPTDCTAPNTAAHRRPT